MAVIIWLFNRSVFQHYAVKVTFIFTRIFLLEPNDKIPVIVRFRPNKNLTSLF